MRRFRTSRRAKTARYPEAQAALEHANRAVARAEARQPEAEALGRWLRRVREANHFSERAAALRRMEGEGHAHGS